MINETNSNKPEERKVSKYDKKTKLIIAIGSGIVSLLLLPFGLNAQIGSLTIVIPWSIILPILTTMALGWRYGFISGIAGGALFPFLLWPEDGYANLLTTCIFLFFYIAIGYAIRTKLQVTYHKVFYQMAITFGVIFIVFIISYRLLFNILLSFNPPFWYSDTIDHFTNPVLMNFIIKDFINILLLTAVSETLLRLPVIRRFFGLTVTPAMRDNHKIFWNILIGSFILWIVFVLLDSTMINHSKNIYDEHILLALIVIFCGGIISSRVIIHYIEQQFQTNDALRESESNLQLQFDLMPIACIIWDSDLCIRSWNPSAEKLFGYSSNDVVGKKNITIILQNGEQDVPTIVFEKLIQGDYNEHHTNMNITKDGKYILCEWTNTPLKDENGRITRILSMGKDITEQEKFERTLRESEERYRASFLTSPDSININQMDGRFIDINEGFTMLTGYTREEVIGKLSSEINIWAIPEDRLKLLEGLMKEGIVNNLETTFRLKNETLRTGLMSARIIKFNGVPHILSITRDISERKQFEETLRVLSRAIEQSPASIVITNLKGDIEYVNPKFSEVTMYSSDEIIGQNLRILKSGYTSQEEYSKLWDTILSGNEWSGVFCNTRKNGEQYWESALISPIINNNGEITHFVAVKEDITERRETERRITSAIIEAEEREKNRFSVELHDGLGPLLSTIKLYFQWLSETSDPEKKKLIIEKGDKNINDAIETLREISNNLSPRTLNSFGFIKAIEDFVDNLNQTQKIHINFTSNTDKQFDKNIEVTLYRISTELINNTIKYSHATKAIIEVFLDEINNHVKIIYSDNGEGFDFDEVKVKGKGIGLLNISQRVNSLNGILIIESKKGNGIYVSVELPLKQ